MKQRLMNDLKDAMKNKDTIRKNVIQSIRASILQIEKDNKIELNENEILDVIQKEYKKRQDTLEAVKNTDRIQTIEDTQKEMDIIKQYLPKPISEEEMDINIICIINRLDANSISDMGRVMRMCKDEFGHRVDGKTLSEHVRNILQTYKRGDR